MKFKKFVPTKTGKKIVANAIANRNDILFKRLAFGSGIWNDSDLENAITLKDERQSSLIDTLDIIDETTIRCVASISNKDLESEYDITEIGLFVEIDGKEILYSICYSDEKVTMFTQAEVGFYQIKIGCLQKISSTSESKIYVSNESFISKEMFIEWVEETEDNLNKALDLQNEHLESMESLLENTPYTTVEPEGEFELPVHTINDNEIGAYSTWSSKKIIDAIYPVGSIYMSVNNVNPSELLGGTWVAWGAGRVPVGVDPSDKAFNTVEKKSGEQVHVLTQSELPPTLSFKTDSIGFQVYGEGTNQGEEVATAFGSNTTLTLINSGGGNAHNNLQPYITCYMWKRTA